MQRSITKLQSVQLFAEPLEQIVEERAELSQGSGEKEVKEMGTQTMVEDKTSLSAWYSMRISYVESLNNSL